jgi:uncharacterized protein YyaL (SSP411 family)
MIVDGQLMRSFTQGEARIPAYLEDYAAVGLGFISLYELTFEPIWVERARSLAADMIANFWDDELGAFFDTSKHSQALIARPRDVQDNATPSGTSLAAELLLTLAELLDDSRMRRRTTFILESLATPMIRYPGAFGHLLGVADMAVNGAVEVALAGRKIDKPFQALLHEIAMTYVPSLVLAGGEKSDGIPLMAGRSVTTGKATAYVCRAYACEEPAGSPEKLRSQLEQAGRIAVQA